MDRKIALVPVQSYQRYSIRKYAFPVHDFNTKRGESQMNSYECSECHGLCDPGELEGGICYECRSNLQGERNGRISKSRNLDKLDKRIRARYAEQSDGQTIMSAN